MYSVKVIKWGEHNPRKEYKSPRWFALNNRVLEDPDFFGFDGDEFKAWIYILCQCSQKNKCEVLINPEHANRVCRISEKKLKNTLLKLQTIGIITYDRHTNANVPATVATLHNNTEQNKTNITEQYITSAEPDIGSADSVILFSDELLISFLSKVPIAVQQAWLGTYQDHDWITHQLKEAVTWIHGNPTKAPKSLFAKFFSGWLSRSWEWKRKNNRKVVKSGIEEWMEEQKAKEL